MSRLVLTIGYLVVQLAAVLVSIVLLVDERTSGVLAAALAVSLTGTLQAAWTEAIGLTRPERKDSATDLVGSDKKPSE